MTDPKKGKDPALNNTGQRMFEREPRTIWIASFSSAYLEIHFSLELVTVLAR
ncbi:MAG: hypothetical protein ACLP9D_16265 [Candidatus Bathyarchaeia archaeon]